MKGRYEKEEENSKPLNLDDPVCPLFNDTKIIEQPVDLTTLTQKMTNFATDFISNAIKENSVTFVCVTQPELSTYSSQVVHFFKKIVLSYK